MALLVKKFGGTSIGDAERINIIADKIIASRRKGDDVVVVVSAMGGETNRLIKLSKSITQKPEARELAALVTTGEQVSSALLAMALQARNCSAKSYNGGQANILTDDNFTNACIIDINASAIADDIAAGYVVIVAGFQGVDSNGNITSLGRGGSDTTAVALAAQLQADECQIYTDVAGVYTADPKLVPQARLLNEVGFEEMLELSSQGAQVIQNRAVEFAGRYKVPVRVLSSFDDGPGTLLSFSQPPANEPILSGIAYEPNQAKITLLGLPNEPSIAINILDSLRNAEINVDMIVQGGGSSEQTDFAFTVPRDAYHNAFSVAQRLKQELGAIAIDTNQHVAKVSLVGIGLHSHNRVANTVFKTLSEQGINMHLISTSEIKLSVVIDEKHVEVGVNALHEAFDLHNPSTPIKQSL